MGSGDGREGKLVGGDGREGELVGGWKRVVV